MTASIQKHSKMSLTVYGLSSDEVARLTGNDPQILTEDGGIYLRKTNRRQRDLLSQAVSKANQPETQASSPESASSTAKNWTRRYVERADEAERQGLNHGKCWVCGEIDIETKGAHPSWEGMLICYVYE